MHKKVLVCLPLNDAHRAALEASVPEFEFRFNALDDVHAEDVLWADVVLGNAPVSMISQNKHIEWFQSNSAGPDAYLKPGVLPENCMVTNATGAYGLAISEWMLAMWLGIQKDMFLYRDRQNQRQWAPIDRPVRGITGARVLCVGMGDIGSNFARRAHMLGAEVVGVRRTVHPDTPCPDYCLRVVAQSQLDEELPEADLIALSLPGTPETNKLFNAERFARCKDGAILINVGRGTTVDSDALVEALRSGKILARASTSPTRSLCLPTTRCGVSRALSSRPTTPASSACPRRWTTSWTSSSTTSSATLRACRWTIRSTAPPAMPPTRTAATAC